MNKALLNKILPHLLAFVIFLVVALVYCKPILQGQVLSQADVTQWTWGNKQSVDFKTETGHYPLWTNSLFSGMPTFMIGYDANNVIPWKFHSVFTLGLPIPVQFFFLACICFYFLALVLRVKPFIGILGALAFAYATYNPIIISVGHDTKMFSIAYMPALLASVLLIYEKKYWIGAGLTALFTSIIIAMNHFQIDYYLFLAIAIMTLFYTVRWVREKEIKHFVKSISFTVIAAGIGLMVNAVQLLATYEYQKESIRGVTSVLTPGNNGTGGREGLEKDYALNYSFYPSESFVTMIPRIYGGSDSKDERGENSKVAEALSTMPPDLQNQIIRGFYGGGVSYYWGGLEISSGPAYLGIVVCFLAIIGLVVLDNKHRWWILTTVILTVLMSWGKYFEGFNGFLFEHLPLYNKFRAPSMIMVIPQLLLPIAAVLGLQKIISTVNPKDLLPKFKKALYIIGGFFIVFFLLYMSFDYNSDNERSLMRQVSSINQPQLTQLVSQFVNAVKEDRETLFLNDIFRALGFVAAAALLLFLLIRNKIKENLAIWGLCFLVFVDLIAVDLTYLNKDNYVDKDQSAAQIAFMSPEDQQILQDTGYYRVFNIAPNAFTENKTSYFHNSIGGYHTARLRLYQDIIENQLRKSPPNLQVLNMLNTRYIIETNPQTGQRELKHNPEALGACWLVNGIRFVKSPREEMDALDSFNPADTAIVHEKFKADIPFSPQPDSTASIQLIANNNDDIQYRFSAASNQFAVFSEVYYVGGWNAYIDGKKAPIVKTDYILRGLAVPAGEHTIEFRFEPQGYYTGRTITFYASTALMLLLLGSIFITWRQSRRTVA